jgi:glycosyltransferase involved in cell wall biosynthesis
MRRLAMSTVDRFIAVSRSVVDGNLLEDGRVPFTIVPNFIPDPERVADPGLGSRTSQPPSPAQPSLPDEPFLLYVGAISRVKGVPQLLRAYRELDAPPPLVLIGYPGEESAAILHDRPAGTTVLMSQPHPTVLAAWERSRVAVIPSVCRDASPTVVLEAMAAGKPIVASRIGGITDQIEPEINGILVEPGNESALRDALARVIGDDGLAGRLSAAAIERSRSFTASAVVPRIEAVYRDALADRGRVA